MIVFAVSPCLADRSINGLIHGLVRVPSSTVLVTSAAGGRAELEVSTLPGQPAPGNAPVAGNDAFTVAEDSGITALSVLANDTVGGVVIDPAVATITIAQSPALGAAVVVGGAINYTPNLNARGSALLVYTVTVNGLTSAPALVAVTITNVNDAPVANADTATGVGGLMR